ncbi:radical SAM/SPASM domain-containing protein [Rhodoflexus caldus]|uniref:radical SAM/SPASM domain-containing protein n=1 Tax=Rhodoflexus caldus TaxID=2891236 RepID=UPI00202A1AE7|nr:SPASM domain-containing protein [Rhodoflexus caldus]
MWKNWTDRLHLLQTLTPAKIFNLLQLMLSYRLSKYLRRPLHKGLPAAVSIEPTTACNLRCPECPSGLRSFTRPTGMLQAELFKKNIDELQKQLIWLTFYFQGEPYLHPQFTELVRYAHERGIYTATSTNAHFLNDENARKTVESGLSRLIISIDGTTQETYQAYRIGGKLEKVIEGARRILSWKKQLKSATPHVIFQFLVVKPNEHQIDEVKALAKELGVDEVQLKTAQIYDYHNGSPLIPTQSRYSRYARQADGTYQIKNPLENSCWKMWHSCVITWDGKVVPCCFDKDAHHTLGNVAEQPFARVWRSETYRQFRQALLHSRQEIDICRNCTEGMKIFEE